MYVVAHYTMLLWIFGQVKLLLILNKTYKNIVYFPTHIIALLNISDDEDDEPYDTEVEVEMELQEPEQHYLAAAHIIRNQLIYYFNN